MSDEKRECGNCEYSVYGNSYYFCADPEQFDIPELVRKGHECEKHRFYDDTTSMAGAIE